MSRVKQLPSEHCGDMSEGGTYETMLKLTVAPEEYRSIWHFTKKDLEKNSMSLKDGIDWKRENDIRSLYCSFIQDLGIELKLPQFTIAAAIMFCHRFYLRQSHAKNNWKTVATACTFLASKVEETPCLLDKVVAVAYKMIHKKDPSVAQKIQSKEFFAKQKELIVIGERVVLSTIGFDFNIQLPYKPLVVALKKLKLQKELMKMAWNFVNDWIRTTLCLQYKPHYIAAGSLYLAAKLNNVALPSQRGSVWWHEFDVVPQQLQEVIQQMLQHIGCNSSTNALCAQKKSNDPQLVAKQATSSSPASCVLSQDGSNSSSPATEVISGNGVLSVDKNLTSAASIPACRDLANDRTGSIAQRQLSESPNCTVEDDTSALKQIARIKPSNDLGGESIPASVCSNKLDVKRIRAMLKKRRRERNDKAVVTDESVEDMLEREIENEVGLRPSCEKVARTDENSQKR